MMMDYNSNINNNNNNLKKLMKINGILIIKLKFYIKLDVSN